MRTRVKITDNAIKLWISANDTHNWARRWPCSFLAGKRLFAEFDSHGLVDMDINGGRGDQDCPADEFNAITSDALQDKVPKDHPVYLVNVGQFLDVGGQTTG